MRLVAWNILQGALKRANRVADALLTHKPDVVVLTEYHPEKSEVVANSLSAAGLSFHTSAPAGYGYEVFIASASPLQAMTSPPAGSLVGGFLEVRVPAYGVIVAGVYVPVISAVPLSEKRRFWGRLHDAVQRHQGEPFIIVGDLNTGDFPLDKEHAGRPFSCTREYRRMAELGMVEAWRAWNGALQEYSWRSNRGTGFRIDHAFVSPNLRTRLVGARYSHGEREAGLSDHSVLIVEFAPVNSPGHG